MGHIKEFRIPEKYDTKWMWNLLQSIRTAVNNLEDTNFPKSGLTGGRIIREHSLPVNRLTSGEFHLPFVALGSQITTTSTSFTNVGGIVVYDPVMWGDVAALVFDVTGGPAASATATFRIIDGASREIVSISATAPGSSRYTATVPSDKVPTTSQPLIVQYKTSDSAVAAGLVSARLIVRP